MLTKMGFTPPVGNLSMPLLAPKISLMPINQWAKRSCIQNLQIAQVKRAKNIEKPSEGARMVVYDHITYSHASSGSGAHS